MSLSTNLISCSASQFSPPTNQNGPFLRKQALPVSAGGEKRILFFFDVDPSVHNFHLCEGGGGGDNGLTRCNTHGGVVLLLIL